MAVKKAPPDVPNVHTLDGTKATPSGFGQLATVLTVPVGDTAYTVETCSAATRTWPPYGAKLSGATSGPSIHAGTVPTRVALPLEFTRHTCPFVPVTSMSKPNEPMWSKVMPTLTDDARDGIVANVEMVEPSGVIWWIVCACVT